MPNTNCMKLSSTMDLTADKRITGAVNCTKPASGAGENATNGGMSMSIAGITTMIGMIAITKTPPHLV